MVKQRLLPLAVMEKLMKNAGAERVSEDAKIILKRVLEDFSFEISALAMKNAINAGRKTINSEDVEFARNVIKLNK